MTFTEMFERMAALKKDEPLFTLGNGMHIPVARAILVCSQRTIEEAGLTQNDVVMVPIGVSLVLSDVVPPGQIYVMDRKYIADLDPPCISDPDAAYTVFCEGLTEKEKRIP
jgi:hypothetical protein